jgi:hypothetical protein
MILLPFFSAAGMHIIRWVDIGTKTEVPLRFVTYLSKVTKIKENSVLTQ